MLLLLRQLPDELAYVRDALRLSDEEIHAVASLQTAKRQFSTAFFMNGRRGRGVVSIRVGALEYWIATNDPNQDEPLRRRALREAGGGPWRAGRAAAREETGRGNSRARAEIGAQTALRDRP